MSLFVFVPGAELSSLPELKSHAIVGDLVRDLITDDRLVVSVQSGPGQQHGTLFTVMAPGMDVDRFGFYPDQQYWERGSDGVWYGWPLDLSLGPAHLIRERCPATQVDRVIMADGSIWNVPVLREPVVSGRVQLSVLHQANLPCGCWPVGDSWQMEVLPQYLDLFERSRSWFDFTMQHTEGRFSYVDVFRYAVEVLGLNYRINLGLHSVFKSRFLNTENIWEVIQVSCGYRAAVEHLDSKKKIVG